MLTILPLLLISCQQTFTPLGDNDDFVVPEFRAALEEQGKFSVWPKVGHGEHYTTSSIMSSVRERAALYIPRVVKQGYIPENLASSWRGVKDSDYRLYYRAKLANGTKIQILETESDVCLTFSSGKFKMLNSPQEAKEFIVEECSEFLNVPSSYWNTCESKFRERPLESGRRWYSGGVSGHGSLLATTQTRPWWFAFIVYTDGRSMVILIRKPEYVGGSATGLPSLPRPNRFTDG